MKKSVLTFLLMGILVFGAVAPANLVSAQSDKVKVLIGFSGKPDVSLVKQHGGNLKDDFYPFINVVSAELPSNAIEGLQKNPKISYIEPDLIATAHGHSPSAGGEYSTVWGVDHIDADLVHASGQDGTNVKVVVIDTGINYFHQDLEANYKGGIDYVNDDNYPYDDHGHGSHVSGTIAGVSDNGGIIGVAPAVDLYGVKVLNSSGSGYYSDVISGIQWAAVNDMDIANLSLGGGYSTSLCNAVTAATISGVLIIASAGNSGNPPGKGTNTGYPATCQDAIAVAATKQNDSRASFSSTGQAVEISGPGVGVYSSVLGNSYASWSGTSMAAPHVSGVAALVKDANPNLTPQELRIILQETANGFDTGRDNLYGFGLVNGPAAVAAAGSNPISPTPDFTISALPNSFSVNVGASAVSTITINTLNGFSGTVDLTSSHVGDAFLPISVDTNTSTESLMTIDTSTIGTYQITIIGSSGVLSDSTTIDLTVIDPNAPVASSVSVSNIYYDREGGKNNDKHLKIYVSLLDNLNQPVSDASVTISLTCDCSQVGWTGTVSSIDGVAKFTKNNAKSGTYTTIVTNVVADGLNWIDGDKDEYSDTSSKTNSANKP